MADKVKYEAAVARVKASYSKGKEQTAEPLADKTPIPNPAPQKPVNIAADIDNANFGSSEVLDLSQIYLSKDPVLLLL